MGFCTKCGSYRCRCYDQEYDQPKKFNIYEPLKQHATFEPSKKFERLEDNGPNCPYCKRNHYGTCTMRVRYAHDPHFG